MNEAGENISKDFGPEMEGIQEQFPSGEPEKMSSGSTSILASIVEECEIVSKKEGEILGEVTNIFLDLDNKKVSGIEYRKNVLGEKFFVPVEYVEVIGKDVVIIKDKSCAMSVKNFDKTKNKEVSTLRGKWVTTFKGKHIGSLKDVFINQTSFDVEEIYLSDDMKLIIDSNEITFGEDELLVPESYEDKKIANGHLKTKGSGKMFGRDVMSDFSNLYKKMSFGQNKKTKKTKKELSEKSENVHRSGPRQ